MGKKPRQWSPDGLKYLIIVNPFGWRKPPDRNSRNVTLGPLLAWVNHALGHREGDSVVQELAWRAKTGTSEAILVGIDESVDIKGLLGEHRWSEFCLTETRPDSSYIFETKYESLAHACGADSWKRVETDLRPAGAGEMFVTPYPRPHWADSRKQCAEMNVQVSTKVKTIPAPPQPEQQDIKPDPSVSQPHLVFPSVFGPSGSGNNPQRPSRPAYTGLMPSTAAQTSQVAQGVYPSPRGMSSQEEQEPSENLVHSEVNVPRLIPSLPETMSTQALFSIGPEQPGNRHSDPHEAATSVLTDATAAVPEPQVKMEVSEGPVVSVGRTTAAYVDYLARISASRASIPTTAFTQAPPPSPRSAFPADVRSPSNTPETPTTHVKTEHTFEPASPANGNPLGSVVSVNRSSSAVSLPAAGFELTATLPLPSIAGSGPLSGPEQVDRSSVKPEPDVPLTNLAPPVARLGTSPLTDSYNQSQGTSSNVTGLPGPKTEAGIDDRSAIYDLLTPSSALNKRKSSSTTDRDRQSKRARLDGGSR